MSITIRRAQAADAAKCGAILYSAFQKLAHQHNFPRDFPSAEVATGLLSMLLANPSFYAIVAEDKGRIIGSNFADPRRSSALGRSRLIPRCRTKVSVANSCKPRSTTSHPATFRA